MPADDKLRGFPSALNRLPKMGAFLKHQDRKPFIGVTQGGSSRDNSGAKPAARDADIYHHINANKRKV